MRCVRSIPSESPGIACRKNPFLVKKIKLILAILLVAILAVSAVRISWLDVFHIPGDSMEGALKPDDLIILNKGLYDGVFANLLEKAGIESHPQVNDILVFRRSIADSDYYVKRCIGLPGDLIGIEHGKVRRNGSLMEDVPTIRHLYRLWYANFPSLRTSLENYGIPLFGPGYFRIPGSVYLYLDEGQRRMLSKEATIDSIRLERTDLFHSQYGMASAGGDKMTIIDSMQAFIVPYKGWEMVLDSAHWTCYGNTILAHEGFNIRGAPGSGFYSGNRKIKTYVFKNDYYFLMGDNRDLSFDSRYFGCIPKKLITGRLVCTIH